LNEQLAQYGYMARKPAALTIIFGILALAAASPASATFPGRNGLVAYGARDGVHVMRPDGTRDRLASRVGPAGGAEWGSRGNRIAFAHGGSIWIANLNDGRTRRVTHGRYDGAPSFSPGGGSIAYSRSDGPSPGVWIVRLSEGRKTRIVAGRVGAAEWAPDGRWIAYTLYEPNPTDGLLNSQDVHVVRPNGQDGHVLVDFPNGGGQPLAVQLSWAPDASELAINTEANSAACEGCETLYMVNADGSGLKEVSREGIGSPFYSPDGDSLAYCSFGYAPPNYEPFHQQQALVHRGEHYVGPTCGESWQARP
jgi:dipeptidyl aminopeptidase/acylaminoacyl peptidase